MTADACISCDCFLPLDAAGLCSMCNPRGLVELPYVVGCDHMNPITAEQVALDAIDAQDDDEEPLRAIACSPACAARLAGADDLAAKLATAQPEVATAAIEAPGLNEMIDQHVDEERERIMRAPVDGLRIECEADSLSLDNIATLIDRMHAAELERDALAAALRDLQASEDPSAVDELREVVEALKIAQCESESLSGELVSVRRERDAVIELNASLRADVDRWSARVAEVEAHIEAVRQVASATSHEVARASRLAGVEQRVAALKQEVDALIERVSFRWGKGKP